MGETSGGSEKAFFTNLDKPKDEEVFHVQFNPKEFKLDEKATWKDSEEHQQGKPLLTYEKGQPSKVTLELIFDTTDTLENCYEVYVSKLRAFMATSIETKDEEKNEVSRPPHLTFTWGKFKFDCVAESIASTFLMFKPDGTPLRIKVTLGLKEIQRADLGGFSNDKVVLTAMGSMFSGPADTATTTVVKDGDTANSIAADNGGDARDICAANGWQDPMNPPVGDTAVIPGDPDLATVLAQQQLSEQDGNWAEEPPFDPFAEIVQAVTDAVDDAASAFDDPGELGVLVNSQSEPPA